jgi:hypothetical protein
VMRVQHVADGGNLWSPQPLVKCRYVIASISFRHSVCDAAY